MRYGGTSVTGFSPVDRVLKRVVSASIDAVKPARLFEQGVHLHGRRLDLFGEVVNLDKHKQVKCVAIGKSAEAMAWEIEKLLGNQVSGIIATSVEKHLSTRQFRFFKTGHPFPNEVGLEAAKEIRDLVSTCNRNDLMIFLVSGGGSAAIFSPVKGVSLDEVNETLKLFFNNGVSIDRINLFRRHISLLGGGKLAAFAPDVRKITLIISDVVGEELSSIASGPTVRDSTTPSDALEFLKKSNLIDRIPKSITSAMSRLEREFSHVDLKNNSARIIASNVKALNAAEKVGIEEGFNTLVLTRFLNLDTRSVASLLVSIARSYESERRETSSLVLLGGETIVKISGEGIGGRNQQLILETLYGLGELAAQEIFLDKSTFFSFGTDGKDGNSDAAGAYVSHETLKKAVGGLQEIREYISCNDSNSFFNKYGGLISTGPTDTNVMDIMGIIVK